MRSPSRSTGTRMQLGARVGIGAAARMGVAGSSTTTRVARAQQPGGRRCAAPAAGRSPGSPGPAPRPARARWTASRRWHCAAPGCRPGAPRQAARPRPSQRAAQQGAPAAGGKQGPDPAGRPSALGRPAAARQALAWPPESASGRSPPARRAAARRRSTGDEGALGRQRLQIALGDQPLIGQQHGDARNGELLGQHAGGRHARARVAAAPRR